MGDKYAGERSDPTYPMCGKLALRFDGAALVLTDGAEEAGRWTARSGRQTSNGGFDYGQARQGESRQGPIPEGIYWICPGEFWFRLDPVRPRADTADEYAADVLVELILHAVTAPRAAWGDARITIHPFKTTDTKGRGGFFIHGGAVFGSAGCIDLAGGMDDFADRLVRLTDRGRCQIHLTVAYARASQPMP